MTSLHASSLRLTPSNSPFFRSPSPRSPTKPPRNDEACLHLKKVIGTTAASANGFSFLPAENKFAFTAGAAAVIASVDQNLLVKQDFFRANPSLTGVSRDAGPGWPSTPTPSESRQRPGTALKETASPREWSDSPTGKSTTAKDRVKAASSVALSPNGKWIAIGETGYRPRILIFPARDGSSESPICVLAEHTFGVHALSFSPDSRFLASLGTINDGYLFLWSIEERSGTATLYASNKLTTTIHSLAWVGRTIVTAGLRFVKVWRPDEDSSESKEGVRAPTATPRAKPDPRYADYGNSILSPKHRVLSGKNSLLGELLDATFISVIAVSDCKAIICAESGEICVLDDAEKTQWLSLAAQVGFTVTAARIDDQELYHVAGKDGQEASFLIPDLERRSSSKISRSPSVSPSKTSFASGGLLALATLDTAIVEIDSNKTIRLRKPGRQCSTKGIVTSRQLPAHQEAVVGIVPMQSTALADAAFFTFSRHGIVRFWDVDGASVADPLHVPIDTSPDMYGVANEIRTATAIHDGRLIASGDKYGSITLVDIDQRRCVFKTRAHSAEVLDVIGFDYEGRELVVTASRDRTVQLFVYQGDQLDLLQTMDEHAGAVTGLLYCRQSMQLLSSSSDRSIVVRHAVLRQDHRPETLAFIMLRAITLKAAPTSIQLTDQPYNVLVATLDRSIAKYSTKTGHSGFTFKCSDTEGGEAVVPTKIVYSPSLNGNPTIAAISNDKSIRLYSEYGSMIARDFGHTEGVTDIALVAPHRSGKDQASSLCLVTSAADSTIFIWESMATALRSKAQLSEQSNNEDVSILGPPLRKVLSQSEMSRMRRDRSTDEHAPSSPKAVSPPKVRKKSSRLSLAQTPRLEPAFRSNFDPPRPRSLMQRSPSPPSPRHAAKKDPGRGTYANLRSKSSENVLSTSSVSTSNTGFGSLTSSCDSVCRSLRMLRKKMNSAPIQELEQRALLELERELKLTARAVGERSQITLDESVTAKRVDEASDKIAGLMDGKIKTRVDDDFRKNGDTSSPSSSQLSLSLESENCARESLCSETAPGALDSRTIVE